VLPFWLETVHRHLAADGEPHIVTVREDDRIIAVAPLAVDSDTAAFLGSHEVCDYQDMVCVPGRRDAAMEAVLSHLAAEGVRRLDLRTLRPDAVALDALKTLMPAKVEAGLGEADVTFEVSLPGDWEGYLMQLNGKQRHEVRRKVRRLESHGPFAYRLVSDGEGLNGAAADFVDLFRRNRTDKAHFMSDTMAVYFHDLIRSLSAAGLLRLYFLDVDDQPVSTVLCFDYDGVRYLYNSGYDENYNNLSVGVLSKVFSIEAAIEMGCRHYDFLKGAEVYKKRIGGNEVPLYRLRVEI
jgi:CelD/BcsL family acetyltransferase involved in cellulose biosynthesis